MIHSTTDSYAGLVARAIFAERTNLAASWLARLNEILEVDPSHVFPSDQLLDHIPLLIAEIAAYLRAPEAEEIAANTSVIEKARELGGLRHSQRASVHQLLREYEILGEILENFVITETERLALSPTAGECFGVISRLTRATRTLMRATVDTFVSEYTATLQERNERIDKFNRMTSHELRTPVGTLTFAAALLGNELVTRDRKRLDQVTAVVRNNVERLAWLIDNLQRIARLDAPIDVPSHQRIEVTTFAADVVSQLHEMAAARGVDMRVQPALPIIFADPARLELILLNLLSNAIKYSDPDKPHRYVAVNGDPAIAADGSWTLRVSDNGLGIRRADQKAVFDRFFRAHEALDRKLGITGSGLGLAIVADCVTAANASIRFESEEGQGTAFEISFHDVREPQSPVVESPFNS